MTIWTPAHHVLPAKVEGMLPGLPASIVDAISTVYDLGYNAGRIEGTRAAQEAITPCLAKLAAQHERYRGQAENNAQLPEAPLPGKWQPVR